jgi:hypothetical protein
MAALENIFKGSYRKGDKSIPNHPPQVSKLHACALSSWSLLISIAPTFSVQKKSISIHFKNSKAVPYISYGYVHKFYINIQMYAQTVHFIIKPDAGPSWSLSQYQLYCIFNM